jgi:glycine/D-amino acid oxidase-like deaminating enzyme
MKKQASAFGIPLWSAPSTRRARLDRPVANGERVDLAIVGGGILGLSTALHAARLGLSVRLLEAGEIGSGASGLNGGQVIPGLKYDPEALLTRFGPERGAALVEFAAATADSVFDLIRDERLDVPHSRSGWIQAAHTQNALRMITERQRQWSALGADCALLDAGEIERLTGTTGYIGGWLDRRAGVIDPLAYTLELARLCVAAGVVIAVNERATSLTQREAIWEVTTASGRTVTASTVVVATNAYADALVPGLARTIIPLHSFQIATAPLPAALGRHILPEGQAVSDSRRILVYFRKSPDGRLILGGRGRTTVPRHAEDWAHLVSAMARLFPLLAGIPIERRWFGRVALTPDHLPHIHEPEPGLLSVAGCQGRGVGLMTALGPRLAAYAKDRDPEALPLPLTPIRPIPFHRFRRLGVATAIGWYRTLDAMER